MPPATNPIVASGADPWVVLWEKAYYYCYTRRDAIHVRKAATLAEIGAGARATVWTAPDRGPYSKNVWAPELHRLGSRWYVYFAADDGENANHRMYALEGETREPQGKYRFAGKVAARTDRWAIDGTVGELNGHLYFVWSGWEGVENVRQGLYIAAMSDPLTLVGDRACISVPEHPWEKVGPAWAGKKDFPAGVNEGPEFLTHGGKTHVIYSANGSWGDDYCLGRLTYLGGNPLDRRSWRKTSEPVFAGTDKVISPGHASFVTSPDGKEDWIVYHAAKKAGAGWDRDVRAQKFAWNADNSPRFGRPLPPGVPIDTPPEK